MTTDRYTKFVLTLIAIGLFVNAGINLRVNLVDDAEAQNVVSVWIDGSSVPLPVNCVAGCD